jgi:hypothetical protein
MDNKSKPTWDEWKAEFIRLCKAKLELTDEEIGEWPDNLKEEHYDQDEVDYLSPNDALDLELSYA